MRTVIVPLDSTDAAGAPLASVNTDAAVIYSSGVWAFGARRVIFEMLDLSGTGAACSAFSFEWKSSPTSTEWATDANQGQILTNGGNWAATFYNKNPARVLLLPGFGTAASGLPDSILPCDLYRLKATRTALGDNNKILQPQFRAFVFTDAD